MNRGFKFKIYPTSEQEVLILKTFGCARWIWNQMLSDRIKAYEESGVSLKTNPSSYKQDNPWLKEVDSLALTSVWKQLNSAYSKFFNEPKVGFPKFKSRKSAKRARKPTRSTRSASMSVISRISSARRASRKRKASIRVSSASTRLTAMKSKSGSRTTSSPITARARSWAFRPETSVTGCSRINTASRRS